jgi:hypothetical protein
VYFTAKLQFELLSGDFDGGLREIGQGVAPLVQALPFDHEAEFHCPRNYGVDFWRMEVDRQEFIDLRCNIRFDAVMEFYKRCEQQRAPFQEWRVYSIEREMLWPAFKAFEDFQRKCVDRELDWHSEYKRRAKRKQEKWRSEGSRVLELVTPEAEYYHGAL